MSDEAELIAAQARIDARRSLSPDLATRDTNRRTLERWKADPRPAFPKPAAALRESFAIPTAYAGLRFRSMLEAKWACWFDLAGLVWEYEPFELGLYVPDFVLPNLYTEDLIVEVKPALHADELRPTAAKIDSSGWDGYAIVVGASVTVGLERKIGADGWEWHASHGIPGSPRESRRLWREAGNAIQWRGRR